ncbi:MAG: site-specific integrase, partial [Oscillospiraceae bacterium]
MSSVTARKRNNLWEYRFDGPTINSKRKQYSKSGFSRKSDALKAGNKAYNELFTSGIFFKQTNMSFADLVEKYQNEHLNTIKNSSSVGYRKHIKNNILP